MTITRTFTATGQLQKYVVPPGVTSLIVELWGAAGGDAGTAAGSGGRGAYVKGTLACTPGETLYVIVGKKGTSNGSASTGYGNLGGESPGAYPGGEGGGQSIVFRGGIARTNQRAVAAGGGGAGGNSNGTIGKGGFGGFGAGGVGAAGDGPSSPGGGAAGSSTSSSGGAGGAAGGTAGAAGAADLGGRGGQGSGTAGSGGGGGGGYYGGGGGASATGGLTRGGGGGGGSSYAGGLTSVTNTPDNRTGDGLVIFTIPNLAPYAPVLLSPANGAVLNQALPQRFSWQFGDPNVEDVQASYIFRVSYAGTGSWTEFAEQTTPNNFQDFAAGALGLGDFEWQVRTRDPGGLLGPYSPSGFFTVAAVPATPPITSPSSGASITVPTITVTWTAASQTHYQLRRVADAAGSPNTAVVYSDTGEVANTGGRSAPLTFDTTGRTEHVQLRIKNSGLWSAWATVPVTVAFTAPATPSVALSVNNTVGSITATITNPAPTGGQPAVLSNEVWRKVTGAADSTAVRLAVGIAGGGSYVDRTPASGVDYSYRVVAVGDTGATSTSAWAS